MDVARADSGAQPARLWPARQLFGADLPASLSHEEAAATAPERRGSVTGFALPRYVSMAAVERATQGVAPSRSHSDRTGSSPGRGMPVDDRLAPNTGIGGESSTARRRRLVMHHSLLSGVRHGHRSRRTCWTAP